MVYCVMLFDQRLQVQGFSIESMQRIAAKHRLEWLARLDSAVAVATIAYIQSREVVAYNTMMSYKRLRTLVNQSTVVA